MKLAAVRHFYQQKGTMKTRLDPKSLILGLMLGFGGIFFIGATTDMKKPSSVPQNRLPPFFSQGAIVRYAGPIPTEREEPFPPLKSLKTFKIRQVFFEWALLRDEFAKSPTDSEVWVYLPGVPGGWSK